MKQIMLCLAALIVITACSSEKPTAEEIARRVADNYSAHQSISYDVEYRFKFFSSDDTNSVDAKCIQIRDPQDSIVNAAIWYGKDPDWDKFYIDGSKFSIQHTKKMIYETVCPSKGWLGGNWDDGLIRINFLDPEKIVSAVSDTLHQVAVSDTAIDGRDFWRIDVDYPDDEDYSEMLKSYFVSKTENVIEKIRFKAKFQGNYQYNEWNLSNIKFDKYHKEHMAEKLEEAKKLDYKYELYDPKTAAHKPMLGPGEAAPDFAGETYPDGRSVHLSDYRGKVVVLDYWYMSCKPCIQAIKEINKISDKFAGRDVVVLGLNPHDNENKHKMPKFLEHNEFKYPIIFVDKETPDSYQVSGYPSFFIIGRDGKIVHSHSGYGEGMHKYLDSIITAAL